MKTQINLHDVEQDGKAGVRITTGKADNGVNDGSSQALSIQQALLLTAALLHHPQLGNTLAATLASYDLMAAKLKDEADAKAGELEEDLTGEDA